MLGLFLCSFSKKTSEFLVRPLDTNRLTLYFPDTFATPLEANKWNFEE
jgi:hypothetical protein